jgi:putative hydrolase of the HAD superfamily
MVNESPKNCYYIGDDLEMDIIPCMKIGMRGIWINRINKEVKFNNIKVVFNLEDLKVNL